MTMAAYTARPENHPAQRIWDGTKQGKARSQGPDGNVRPLLRGWLRGLARHGQVGQGAAVAWLGKAGFHSAGQAPRQGSWIGEAVHGPARCGTARQRWAWQAPRQGHAWRCMAGSGWAGRGKRYGLVRRGGARRGKAMLGAARTLERHGGAAWGKAPRAPWFGVAGRRPARRC